MPDIVFCIILLLLTALGVVFCAREVILLLLVPPKSPDISIVIPFEGDGKEMEYTVMCVVKRNRWFDRLKNARIILLNTGMDEEAKKVALLLCRRYSELEYSEEKNIAQSLRTRRGRTESK
ncbi:MAG: hypothetical protein IKS19_00545 [Clostridia bacterium]|nr:hypothetical protein [Clostridia bacterium]